MYNKTITWSTIGDIAFDGHAIGEASCECHLIGILELAAKGNAARDGGDLARQLLDLFLNVVNGGIALYIGIERKDQFFCGFFADAVYERSYVQLIWADTI